MGVISITTSASFIYNFDMQSFYKKTVYDWVDAINDSTFVDTAPSVEFNIGISWESAFLVLNISYTNFTKTLNSRQ